MEIIPAILPRNFKELKDKLSLIAGAAPCVQIDISDGRFTPSKTWPYAHEGENSSFAAIGAEKTGLPFWEEFDFEFDLMVAKPREAVEDFVRAGAARVIIHRESISADALSDLMHEWKHAVDIGLALKPQTPLSELLPFLHEVALVQCMGNDRIGFQGLALDEERVIPKIQELRRKYPALSIGVDIGVTRENVPRLAAAGASRLVVGSAVFGAPDPRAAIAEFKSML